MIVDFDVFFSWGRDSTLHTPWLGDLFAFATLPASGSFLIVSLLALRACTDT